MARPPLVITPELLQLAWRKRRRAHWPATFAEAMADDMLRRLVRAVAVGLAQAATRRARRPAGPPPATQPTLAHQAATRLPAVRHAPAPGRQAALFDPKRLAAGDARDDD